MSQNGQQAYPLSSIISERWSPRAFTGEPIPTPLLRSLLEAARWAPSCFNEQPWSFLVAERTQQASFETMLHCLVEANQRWAKQAAVLLIGIAHTRFARNDKPNRHAAHDLGLASGQLTLEAMHHGLFVHQMAGIDSERIRLTYSIPPDHEPLTGIAIGPLAAVDQLPADLAERERAIRQRKPQSSFVFMDRWQAPFSENN